MRGRLAPAAMYPAGDSSIRTRMVTLASGVRVRLLEAGAPSGAPVLLIHGWGACVFTFRFTLAALAGAGRRVLAFDLRGHGLSGKPAGKGNYATKVLVADLCDLLDGLGIGSVDLVGHSLGGAVALHFTLAHRARVRSLVLAAPVGLTNVPVRRVGHLLSARLLDPFARYLVPRWLTGFLLRGAYGDPRRVTDEAIDEYWAPSQFPNYYRAVRDLLDEFDWKPLDEQDLIAVDARTLVILGSDDRLIRDAEAPARLIPRVTVLTLDGAGHLGIEECPGEFNERLLVFLESS